MQNLPYGILRACASGAQTPRLMRRPPDWAKTIHGGREASAASRNARPLGFDLRIPVLRRSVLEFSPDKRRTYEYGVTRTLCASPTGA